MDIVSKRKGFTMIELLVTIAVFSILVLIGGPRLLGYTEEAELTRIQHDVKVMEQEMKIALLENERLEGFDYNAKDLGLLVETNRLFTKEGHAENLKYIAAEGEINGLSKNERKISSKANSEVIGVGGVAYSIHDELGVGGDEIKLEDEKEFKEIYERYKIVPDSYKDKIKTSLKGTFYTNENGDVYYEHDKPNKIKREPKVLNCDVALPDYEFEPASGNIVKWHGTEQHLIIPAHFLIDGECVPVRVIGEGAFMQGGFKSIMIPPSVLTIERNAFKESGVDSISIPGSVREIRQGAFDGIEEVVYLGGPSRVNNGSGPGTHLAPNGSIKNIVHRYPSAREAGVVFHPESGTIVRGSNRGSGVHIPEYINIGGRDVKVRKVAKGAYQGLGLITVILPETLEIIEDYAFSGNQLIGITIPNSVYHIGNYAFAFNEQTHSLTGNKRATIGFINIKEEDYFKKLNQYGNILENGKKVEMLKSEVKLLDHIFVTSIDNFVIEMDEEYIEKEPEEIDMSTGSDIDSSTGQNVSDGACGSTVFKTNDGIVVTSSSRVFCNQDFYNMANLFDGKLSTDDIYYGDVHSYWLAEGRGSQTLTFDFGEQITISRIDVAPKTRSDTFSNFRIVASNDGAKWDALTDWFITSNSIPASHIESYSMNEEYRYFRIELNTRGTWGASLAEVKFFKQM